MTYLLLFLFFFVILFDLNPVEFLLALSIWSWFDLLVSRFTINLEFIIVQVIACSLPPRVVLLALDNFYRFLGWIFGELLLGLIVFFVRIVSRWGLIWLSVCLDCCILLFITFFLDSDSYKLLGLLFRFWLGHWWWLSSINFRVCGWKLGIKLRSCGLQFLHGFLIMRFFLENVLEISDS